MSAASPSCHRAGPPRPIAGPVTGSLVSTSGPGVLFRDHLRRAFEGAPERERADRTVLTRCPVGASPFLPAARAMRAATLRPSGCTGGRPSIPRDRLRRQAADHAAVLSSLSTSPHLQAPCASIFLKHGGLTGCGQSQETVA
jgi:hypothetical protein